MNEKTNEQATQTTKANMQKLFTRITLGVVIVIGLLILYRLWEIISYPPSLSNSVNTLVAEGKKLNSLAGKSGFASQYEVVKKAYSRYESEFGGVRVKYFCSTYLGDAFNEWDKGWTTTEIDGFAECVERYKR